MHVTFSRDRMSIKLTNPYMLWLGKHQSGSVSPVTFFNIVSHVSGFCHVGGFQIFSIYLHWLISGFLANTCHFGTDNITKVMISVIL